MATTKKEIAKSIKTLIVMLQSLRNQQVAITLRNDTIVRGTIIKIDADMNIELQDATLEFDQFYCTDDEQTRSVILDEVCTRDNLQEDSLTTIDQEEDHQVQAPTGSLVDIVSDQDNSSNSSAATCDDDDDGDDESKSTGANQSDDQHPNIPASYEYFIVKGSRIRHIDLPTDNDLLTSAKCEIERIRSRRKQWSKRDIVRSSNSSK